MKQKYFFLKYLYPSAVFHLYGSPSNITNIVSIMFCYFNHKWILIYLKIHAYNSYIFVTMNLLKLMKKFNIKIIGLSSCLRRYTWQLSSGRHFNQHTKLYAGLVLVCEFTFIYNLCFVHHRLMGHYYTVQHV